MSWTNQTKNSASYTNQDEASTIGLVVGTPIGLLLTLTHTQTQEILGNEWTNLVKN